jgi:hypothetical protein
MVLTTNTTRTHLHTRGLYISRLGPDFYFLASTKKKNQLGKMGIAHLKRISMLALQPLLA